MRSAVGLLRLAVSLNTMHKKVPVHKHVVEALQATGLAKAHVDEHWRLHVTHMLLSRGGAPPWPRTLIQVAAHEGIQPAFARLVGIMSRSADRFSQGSHVLVWNEEQEGWERAVIEKVRPRGRVKPSLTSPLFVACPPVTRVVADRFVPTRYSRRC